MSSLRRVFGLLAYSTLVLGLFLVLLVPMPTIMPPQSPPMGLSESPECNLDCAVEEALAIAPQWVRFQVDQWVTKIEPGSLNAAWVGNPAWGDGRTVTIRSWGGDRRLLAATLVHETYHIMAYWTCRPYIGPRGERRAIEWELVALAQMGVGPQEALTALAWREYHGSQPPWYPQMSDIREGCDGE